mmetsp:Transcript_21886/g.41183  ORF Transcript_21886/g.41183 Transcript_21886/m.41183 type:complete len:837 (+) Transcript_21886:285-2795(+)|eukprot:CAMPEP_0182494678 /NCGR_PEP_ID=MMETSP1321-20130603/3539_1 /TAXON_ID=91990 /ORGANISM="Bolidomonas sp., Strain RCC1657" /LENGTH=836 /DNA_ID=CAMNT_0024697837 /DNA_START=263 /DNA_END=2773 /DNA_ORIENTATION=-
MTEPGTIVPSDSGNVTPSVSNVGSSPSVPATPSAAANRLALENQVIIKNDPIMDKILKSKEFNVLMVVLTVYALFGDDIRLAFYDLEDDQIFFNLSIFAMVMFIIEMALQFYFRIEYRWGFYFILDILSTASMIPDTNLLNELMTGEGGDGGEAAGTLKAGKTSRAGAKAGRVVKIVRLIRFVRIFKILKMRKQNMDDNEESDVGKTLEDKLQDEPSKVGKKLTELTVRRVIVIVLAMIMVFPFLDDPESFIGETEFNSYEVKKLNDLHIMTDSFNATGNITQTFFKQQVQYFASSTDIKEIVYMKLNNWDVGITNMWVKEVTSRHLMLDDVGEISDLFRSSDARIPESSITSVCDVEPANGDCGSFAYYNLKSQNQAASMMSLLKTVVIVIGLSISVIGFSRDAETLVIEPIERMIKLVKALAENPLASLYREKNGGDEGFETTLLETTLEKISSLLQVGFGVAGAQIIQSNMSSGGDLDVMIPGKKITAVFGFGIMEEFTNTCSCLEEEMCTYINTIAKIIHDNSVLYHGAPNKNIGSAFLLVWKICEGVLPGLRDLRDASSPELSDGQKADLRMNMGCLSVGGGEKERVLRPYEMVDSSMIGVLKMRIDLMAANGAGGTLEKFKKSQKIVDYYEGNFEVEMGFGLHIGWAIEGAIGSNYKIDASYLSPNVNMAARLEAATHQFGTPLLLSGPFCNELSPAAKALCRKIDVVTVKGSQIPLELWTCDLTNYDTEAAGMILPQFSGSNENREQLALDFERVKQVQKDFDQEFKATFEEGVEFYVKGEWDKAKTLIDKCLSIYPKDGPSDSLNRVMERADFTAPKDWKGFRELTSK